MHGKTDRAYGVGDDKNWTDRESADLPKGFDTALIGSEMRKADPSQDSSVKGGTGSKVYNDRRLRERTHERKTLISSNEGLDPGLTAGACHGRRNRSGGLECHALVSPTGEREGFATATCGSDQHRRRGWWEMPCDDPLFKCEQARTKGFSFRPIDGLARISEVIIDVVERIRGARSHNPRPHPIEEIIGFVNQHSRPYYLSETRQD